MGAVTHDQTPPVHAPSAPGPTLAVDRTAHRRRGILLVVLGVFQLWLWVTRTVNLVTDPTPRSTGFVVVHAVLYGAAFLTAFLLLGIGARMWREARASAAAP